jgi:hypothetical protein
MQSVKSAVLTALQTATGLSVYFTRPPTFTTLPVISYFEVNNIGSLFADDVEIGSSLTYQVDIWGNSSLTSYANSVNTAMTGLNFVRTLSQDLYEQDTKIYHKVMRFRLEISDPSF